jgi:hypothetical protein
MASETETVEVDSETEGMTQDEYMSGILDIIS